MELRYRRVAPNTTHDFYTPFTGNRYVHINCSLDETWTMYSVEMYTNNCLVENVGLIANNLTTTSTWSQVTPPESSDEQSTWSTPTYVPTIETLINDLSVV